MPATFNDLYSIATLVREAGYEARIGQFVPMVEITDPVHTLVDGQAVITGERKVQIATMREAISFIEARA